MVGLEDLHYDCLERIFANLTHIDNYTLSRLCRSLRKSVLQFIGDSDKKKVPVPWEYVKIDVGRPITVLRKKRVGMKRNRAEWKEVREFKTTESDLLNVSRFFRLGCEFIHLRARCFSNVTVDALGSLVKNCADGPNQTLLFEADKVTLEPEALRQFLDSCNPLALHFYGRFDRSLITHKVIPASAMNLFVGEDLVEKERCSHLSGDFFLNMVERWRGSTGLRIPAPRYSIGPFESNSSGNARQLDIDYCHVTIPEIYKLFESMLTVTNVCQLIRFYNVPSQMNDDLSRHLNRMSTLAERTVNSFIESRRIDNAVRKEFEFRKLQRTNASVGQPGVYNYYTCLKTRVVIENEEFIDVELTFYAGAQEVRAVLPEVVADWTRMAYD